MSKAPSRAAALAARLRALANDGGPYSLYGRLRPGSLDPLVQRFSRELPENASDADLAAAMGRFAVQYPQHFRTYVEVTQDKRTPEQTRSGSRSSDAVHKMLGAMTPQERISFANHGAIPPRFKGRAE